MVSDLEVFQCANILLKSKGHRGAVDLCVTNIHAMSDQRDVDGEAVWRRILFALEALALDARPAGATVN